MRSFCESSISSEGMKNIERVTVIVVLISNAVASTD